MQDNTGKARLLVVAALLLILGAGGVYLFNAEKEGPWIELSPDRRFINDQTSLSIAVKDEGSGLAEIEVLVKQKDAQLLLLAKEFDSETSYWQGSLNLEGQGLQDQELVLQVRARDHSWANLFQGNLSEFSREYELDNSSPQISLQTFVHNLNQGGSGLVGFSVSESVRRAGVEVQDTFFPAYEQEPNHYLCLFSFPYFFRPDQARPVIVAEDRAGNLTRAGFNQHVNSRSFPSSRINVTDDFIQNTVFQFSDKYPQAKDGLELFLQVNQDLRQENRKKLKEIGRDTSPQFLWSGRFLRQPNSSRMAGFADERSYFFQGEKIDQQTHLGLDLASVARDKVLAANSGRVVYADKLGIYGQVVIVDHGLGLQSMYAHLSQIQVQQGEMLQRGQTLGRTGTTGLAAGDHLHFEILVSGVSVNPVEWWDPAWIQNNILNKLELADE